MISLTGRLELLCGFLLVPLEMSVPLVLLTSNYDSPRDSYTSSKIFEFLVLGAIHYLLPGLLVAIGSYVQVIKKHGAGLLCILAGSIIIITDFYKSLFALAFVINGIRSKDLGLLLIYSVPALALVVLILSFIVAFQRRDSSNSEDPGAA